MICAPPAGRKQQRHSEPNAPNTGKRSSGTVRNTRREATSHAENGQVGLAGYASPGFGYRPGFALPGVMSRAGFAPPGMRSSRTNELSFILLSSITPNRMLRDAHPPSFMNVATSTVNPMTRTFPPAQSMVRGTAEQTPVGITTALGSGKSVGSPGMGLLRKALPTPHAKRREMMPILFCWGPSPRVRAFYFEPLLCESTHTNE